jgi:hypothetical protein
VLRDRSAYEPADPSRVWLEALGRRPVVSGAKARAALDDLANGAYRLSTVASELAVEKED